MIYYFQESLKPFNKVKIKQQDWEFVSFKKIVQQIVKAEVKADLKSNIMVQNLDIYYLKNYCPSNITFAKVKTKKTTITNFYPKKTKAKDSKPALPCINAAEHLE